MFCKVCSTEIWHVSKQIAWISRCCHIVARSLISAAMSPRTPCTAEAHCLGLVNSTICCQDSQFHLKDTALAQSTLRHDHCYILVWQLLHTLKVFQWQLKILLIQCTCCDMWREKGLYEQFWRYQRWTLRGFHHFSAVYSRLLMVVESLLYWQWIARYGSVSNIVSRSA